MSTITGNQTHNFTALSKDGILQNHQSVIQTFGIPLAEEDSDLPQVNWISKLQENLHCWFNKVLYQDSFADFNKNPNCCEKRSSEIL